MHKGQSADAKHGFGLVLGLRLVTLRVNVGQKSYQVGKSEAIKLRVAVEELKCLHHLCTFSHLAGVFEGFTLIPFLVPCSLPLRLHPLGLLHAWSLVVFSFPAPLHFPCYHRGFSQ